MRAPLTKAIVELLDAQPPAVRTAVRASAARAVNYVELASRVSWIPLSVQLEILAALHAEVGPQRYDDFCAAHFASTVEQPMVKSVFEGTVRVFGLSPGAVYRMFPRTWSMMSSGCGVVSVVGEPSPAGTTIAVSELPVEQKEIDLFVRGFRATFRGILDVFKREGDVAFTGFDRAARRALYVATWR